MLDLIPLLCIQIALPVHVSSWLTHLTTPCLHLEPMPSTPSACMQRVNVLQFRRELEQVAEEHQVVTYDELLDQCQAR